MLTRLSVFIRKTREGEGLAFKCGIGEDERVRHLKNAYVCTWDGST